MRKRLLYLQVFYVRLKLLDSALVCLEALAISRSLLLTKLCLQPSDLLRLLLDDTAVLIHQILVLCIPGCTSEGNVSSAPHDTHVMNLTSHWVRQTCQRSTCNGVSYANER